MAIQSCIDLRPVLRDELLFVYGNRRDGQFQPCAAVSLGLEPLRRSSVISALKNEILQNGHARSLIYYVIIIFCFHSHNTTYLVLD